MSGLGEAEYRLCPVEGKLLYDMKKEAAFVAGKQ